MCHRWPTDFYVVRVAQSSVFVPFLSSIQCLSPDFNWSNTTGATSGAWLTNPEHLSTRVVWFMLLDLSVVFVDRCCYFSWPLYCPSLDLQLSMSSLVSSNLFYKLWIISVKRKHVNQRFRCFWWYNLHIWPAI